MTEFLSFFVLLFAAVFFSALFNRLHLPWVVALIIGGVVIGPFGFNVFEPNSTIEFLGEVGLVFLMFMAGLETRLSHITHQWRGVVVLALLNGLIPFVVGVLIGLWFGYTGVAALLLGVIFISTSVAVVVPSLEANNIFHTRVGSTIVSATIIEDVVSLLLLSVLLQTTNLVTAIPLWLFYPLLLAILIVLRLAIPRVRWLVSFGRRGKDLFQQEFRLILLLLIGVVVIFELLGLHTIIAGFFAGLVLSESIKSDVLREKLRAVSYGLFIPIFFILIGTQTNLRVFSETTSVVWLAAAVVVGSVLAKFISGWVAARLSGFTFGQSNLVGVATIPSLTTTLAVAFTGLELGLLDQPIVTALVLLSIVTTLIGPGIINLIAQRAARLSVIPSPTQAPGRG